MNKRQARKIMLRYAITGNQPRIYTDTQIRTAYDITDPIKNRKPYSLSVTSTENGEVTYTFNHLIKVKPRVLKVDVQMEDSLPPHGLVVGEEQSFNPGF